MGKILIIAGIVLIVTGLVIQYSDRIPLLGKLPGDLRYEGKNVRVYFPLATSILISLLLSLLLYFFNRLKN